MEFCFGIEIETNHQIKRGYQNAFLESTLLSDAGTKRTPSAQLVALCEVIDRDKGLCVVARIILQRAIFVQNQPLIWLSHSAILWARLRLSSGPHTTAPGLVVTKKCSLHLLACNCIPPGAEKLVLVQHVIYVHSCTESDFHISYCVCD